MTPYQRSPLHGGAAVSRTIRSEADSSILAGELLCPQCEAEYLVLQGCARLCHRCGYTESCEENFAAEGADAPHAIRSADEAGRAA